MEKDQICCVYATSIWTLVWYLQNITHYLSCRWTQSRTVIWQCRSQILIKVYCLSIFPLDWSWIFYLFVDKLTLPSQHLGGVTGSLIICWHRHTSDSGNETTRQGRIKMDYWDSLNAVTDMHYFTHFASFSMEEKSVSVQEHMNWQA